MMDSTSTSSIFAEYKKFFGQFKLPGIEVGTIRESRRKDIAAIAEANTTALAGVQSLAQKQSDMLRSALGELQGFFVRVAQPGGQSLVGAGETVKQTLHTALVDVQELADTAYRAQSDSVAVVTKRVAEHVEELKALLQPKK